MPETGLPGQQGQPTPVVIITHDTTEDHVRSALDAITRDGHVDRAPKMMRIELVLERDDFADFQHRALFVEA